MSEDKNLLFSSQSYDFVIDDFVHELQALDGLLLGNADVLLLQRYWAETVVKIEETLAWIYAEECRDILVIGQGGTEAK